MARTNRSLGRSALAAALFCYGGAAWSDPLLDSLRVSTVEVAEGVAAGVSNWRIWGTAHLNVAPVFTAPLPSCGSIVGYTSGAGSITARVVQLDDTDGVVTSLDLAAGMELRGLAAESDTVFGALLWDPVAEEIFVRRFNVGSGQLSSTELVNATNSPTDFGIGDSRLDYGAGKYGAYYHVHSNDGHEGDTLKWVEAATGAETTGWIWGCSHSMSNVLRFNPAVGAAGEFLPACVTDCFPGTTLPFETGSIGGIYLNYNDEKVMDVDANCAGKVAGELGSAALGPNGWVLAFNAHRNPAVPGQNSYDPATMNQDIGIATVAADLTPGPVVWLTNTAGDNENDAAIARWQPVGEAAEQYVVGWNEGGTHMLSRIGATGTILEGPLDLAGAASWGRRDDPFRALPKGDIGWSWFDDASSTTLNVARLRAGGPTCGCQDNLLLDDETLAGRKTFNAKMTATLGLNLIANGTLIEVVAGQRVILNNGSEIGGQFIAGTDPGVCL